VAKNRRSPPDPSPNEGRGEPAPPDIPRYDPRIMSRKLVQPVSAAARSANTLRIIGGQWRGTKLHFPDVAAIRPTPDRVRETLFNWLQPHIVGARCLDLFTGSGALGLEALSRGAAHATFVDTEALIVRYLRDTLARLHSDSGEVIQSDALSYLEHNTAKFDVVFMDPPFAMAADGALFARLFALLQQGRLGNPAFVYLECPTALGSPERWPGWPATGWQCHRSKQAGQVGYHLLRVARDA